MRIITMNSGFLAVLICLLYLAASISPIEAQTQRDPETGLAINTGWNVVKTNCIQCHSAQMITQSSGSRAVWKSRILWMQETQGLRQFDNDLEEQILAYLETNYGPKDSARRAPLPSHLMPENPFDSED